ncbi:MAG TPA: hypothetical protein VF553_18115 [Pyrinomonadaceae bacterium]|jgi:hypothetical protein
MNKLIRLMMLGAMVATLALPALAVNNSSSLMATAGGQGEDEAKTALYKKFTDNRTTNQPLAYETAKEYLAKYPEEDQYTAYMKKWVAAYEKGKRKVDLEQMINGGKFAEAYALGKQILVDEPNDLNTLSRVSWAALQLSLTNKEVNGPEASAHARKTLQLIEAGKGFEEGKPLDAKVKEESLNWLNSALGIFALKSNPNESINYFIKSAQHDGFFKTDPQTYVRLALAYQAGPYKKLSDEYQARFPQGSEETPESKAALQNLNNVIDNIIDAYARAVALATDAKYATVKAQWMTQLTSFYKFRHNDTEAGMPELIAGVLSKPLPPQPTLVTTPVPAPPTGTAGTGTTTPATTPATPSTTNTTPARPNTAPARTATPATSAQPTPSPTPSTTSSKPTTPVKP